MKVHLYKKVAPGVVVSSSTKVDAGFVVGVGVVGMIAAACALIIKPFAEWRAGKRVNAILTLIAVLAIASLFVGNVFAAKPQGKPVCDIHMTISPDGPAKPKVDMFRVTCFRDVCTMRIGPQGEGNMTTTATGGQYDSNSCALMAGAFSCRNRVE